MDLLVIGIASLIIGWIIGARWRAGRAAAVSPSEAGRALAAQRRTQLDKRKRDTTRQLELYNKRSRR